MFLTFLLAMLSAFGFLCVLNLLYDAITFHLKQEDLFHVVRISGEEPEVEQTVRSCIRYQDSGRLRGRIVFVDEGLTPDAQTATELLLRGREDAVLCGESELSEILCWERDIWSRN